MIPLQITARKKKYIGNACWVASVPTEGGAGRNADAAPLKIPLYPPFSKGEFLPSQSTPLRARGSLSRRPPLPYPIKGEESRGAHPSGRRDLSLLWIK